MEETPFAVLAELAGIAATWHELDTCDDEPLIGPGDWVAFAEQHEWSDAPRVLDVMISLWSLASVQARGGDTHRWTCTRHATVTPIASRTA